MLLRSKVQNSRSGSQVLQRRDVVILIIILLPIVSCCSQPANQWGIKAGANVSSFSASINSDPSARLGFHAGVYVRNAVSEKITFRLETYYSVQGQKDNFGGGYSSTTTLEAINVPFLFELGKIVSLDFGGQVGILLAAREIGSPGTGINADLRDILKTADFALVGGLGIHPLEHFNMGLRYNFGLTTVFDLQPGSPFAELTIANRVIHAYFAYSF